MPPIADLPAPESPASVGWLVVAFAGIMTGLYYTIEVFKGFRKPATTKTSLIDQPLMIKGEERFATREEHVKLEGRVDDLANEIRAGFERLDQKRSVSIASVHDLVRKQGERLSGIDAQLTAQGGDMRNVTAELREVNSRIDAFPHRIIGLLRETKGLI